MKYLITFMLVATMLLAAGCENTANKPVASQGDSTQVTDVDGNAVTEETTQLPDVSDDTSLDEGEEAGEGTISQENDKLNNAPVEYFEGATDMYLSFTGEVDNEGNTHTYGYNYDEYGRLIEITRISQTELQRTLREYDKYGYLSKETFFSGELLTDYYEYVNDKKGNQLSVRRYNPDGSLHFGDSECRDYKYNANGDMIERKIYVDEDTYKIMTWEYDANGNLLKLRSFSEDGILELEEEYKYDEQGRKTLDSWKDYIDPQYNYSYTTSFVTTDEGHTTVTRRRTGTDVIVEVIIYDENGNMVLQDVYDDNGKVGNKVLYSYEDFGVASIVTFDENDKVIGEYVREYSVINGEIFNSEKESYYNYDENGKHHSTVVITEHAPSEHDSDGYYYRETITEIVDDETYCTTTTLFDKDGRMMHKESTLDDVVTEEIIERDTEGNATKYTRIVNGETIVTYEYEYIKIENAWHKVNDFFTSYPYVG